MDKFDLIFLKTIFISEYQKRKKINNNICNLKHSQNSLLSIQVPEFWQLWVKKCYEILKNHLNMLTGMYENLLNFFWHTKKFKTVTTLLSVHYESIGLGIISKCGDIGYMTLLRGSHNFHFVMFKKDFIHISHTFQMLQFLNAKIPKRQNSIMNFINFKCTTQMLDCT